MTVLLVVGAYCVVGAGWLGVLVAWDDDEEIGRGAVLIAAILWPLAVVAALAFGMTRTIRRGAPDA